MSAKHNQYHAKSRLQTTWLLAGLLLILVLATAAVVGTSLYHYAHRSSCEISLYDGSMGQAEKGNATTAEKAVVESHAVQHVGAQAGEQRLKYGFHVNDTDKVWTTETKIELFHVSYQNEDGTITVQSAGDDKVIAPGTDGTYTFDLKNTGNKAAEYKIWVEAQITSTETGLPLQTKMSGKDGWLLGDADSWEQAEKLDGISATEELEAGKAAEYTIYWQWPFEMGEDERDTALGNLSAQKDEKQDISYTITIHTLAAESVSSDFGGDSSGKTDGVGDTLHSILIAAQTGDPRAVMLYVAAAFLAAGILLLVAGVKHENRKKGERSE